MSEQLPELFAKTVSDLRKAEKRIEELEEVIKATLEEIDNFGDIDGSRYEDLQRALRGNE